MRSNALIVGSLFITAALSSGAARPERRRRCASRRGAGVGRARVRRRLRRLRRLASAPAAGAATVEAKPVGAAGTVLVDGTTA